MISSLRASMLKFGSLQLRSNLFLSPLAGYTNLPFRLTIRKLGGLDLATTDLVNARSLLERNPRAFKLIETNDRDSPLAVQLFGNVPEEMRDASLFLQDRGVASIDINMGCPVRKVCRVGRVGHDDRGRSYGELGSANGRCLADPGDVENAVGLGRSQFDRSRLGAGSGRRGYRCHFYPWSHQRTRVRRKSEPDGH